MQILPLPVVDVQKSSHISSLSVMDMTWGIRMMSNILQNLGEVVQGGVDRGFVRMPMSCQIER
jgi:hypothetical protein